jgi:hypothetical protein
MASLHSAFSDIHLQGTLGEGDFTVSVEANLDCEAEWPNSHDEAVRALLAPFNPTFETVRSHAASRVAYFRTDGASLLEVEVLLRKCFGELIELDNTVWWFGFDDEQVTFEDCDRSSHRVFSIYLLDDDEPTTATFVERLRASGLCEEGPEGVRLIERNEETAIQVTLTENAADDLPGTLSTFYDRFTSN